MKKPELKEYIETVFEKDGKKYGGVNFADYAFALEKYVFFLEQQIEALK